MATLSREHFRKIQNHTHYARKLRSFIYLDSYRSMTKGKISAYALLVLFAISVFTFTAFAKTYTNDNVSTPPILEQGIFFDYSEFQDLPNNISKILKSKIRSKTKKQHNDDHLSKQYDDALSEKGDQDAGEVSSFVNRKKQNVGTDDILQNITFGHVKQRRSVVGSETSKIDPDSTAYERRTLEVHNKPSGKRSPNKMQPVIKDCPLPACPSRPPNLVGRRQVVLNSSSSENTRTALSSGVEEGGRWAPKHCISRYQVAIIVPVRDREEQVWAFLTHMHTFLQRQQLDYTIYIVEQAGSELFNRAKLLNIGFVEALRERKSFDCVVFHDVDMLPEDDRHLYHCSAMPRHLVVASSNEKYKSNLSFMRSKYFGGACMMTPKHVRKVNGWSNCYWGWGGEDDDMWRRVALQDLPVWRYPAAVARYTMLEHGPPPGVNKHSYEDLARLSPYWRLDGLNSLRYTLDSVTRLPHHTRILANVGRPEDDPKLSSPRPPRTL